MFSKAVCCWCVKLSTYGVSSWDRFCQRLARIHSTSRTAESTHDWNTGYRLIDRALFYSVFDVFFNYIAASSASIHAFPGGLFTSTFSQYSFKANGCFPTLPSSKQAIAAMKPVSMTIINPRKGRFVMGIETETTCFQVLYATDRAMRARPSYAGSTELCGLDQALQARPCYAGSTELCRLKRVGYRDGGRRNRRTFQIKDEPALSSPLLKVALQILGQKFYKNTEKSSLYSQSLLIFHS